MSISFGETLLYSIIPFGQYYARVFKLKGSTDHIWGFVPTFNIFPFSLIPMFMIYAGAIKEGKVNSVFEAINYKMIVPIIIRLISVYLISNHIENNTLKIILLFLSGLISSYLINLIDRLVVCSTVDNNKLVSSAIDAVSENLFTFLCTTTFFVMYYAFKGMEFEMPWNQLILGDPFGFSRNLAWIIGYIYVKLALNMDNINNLESYCSQQMFSPMNITKLVIFGFYVAFFIWADYMEKMENS